MNLAYPSKTQSPLHNHSGLTLIEILISMGILVMISFAIYQATVQTFKLRDTLSAEGEFYNTIRISMSLMQKDIALMYSPIATLPKDKRPQIGSSQNPNNTNLQQPPNVQQMQTYMDDDLNILTEFWEPGINNSGVRPSRFKGNENRITFISTSHIRIYKDAPESEFSKVTYEIKLDSKNKDAPSGTYVLVKTESPNAFSGDRLKDTFIRSYELLHGIKKLTYTYLQRDGNTWKKFKDWDSDREETKYLFPDVIEVSIEVVGNRKEYFEGKYSFKPEIPIYGIYPSL